MVEFEVSAEPLPSIGTVQGNKTMGTHALLMGKSTTFLEKRSRPLVHVRFTQWFLRYKPPKQEIWAYCGSSYNEPP